MSNTEDLKSDFLLDLRDAIDKKQKVVLIMWSHEDDEWLSLMPGDKTESNDILNTLSSLPFLGKMSPDDVFKMWEEYYDDTVLAEVYGFELEDGEVQISIIK